jgi:hypothetical protein
VGKAENNSQTSCLLRTGTSTPRLQEIVDTLIKDVADSSLVNDDSVLYDDLPRNLSKIAAEADIDVSASEIEDSFGLIKIPPIELDPETKIRLAAYTFYRHIFKDTIIENRRAVDSKKRLKVINKSYNDLCDWVSNQLYTHVYKQEGIPAKHLRNTDKRKEVAKTAAMMSLPTLLNRGSYFSLCR